MVERIPIKYFIWQGVRSSDYGFLEKTVFPEFSPTEFEFQYIPSRSTPLVMSQKTRNAVTISVNLQHVHRAKYNSMYSWLNNGNELGSLIICDDLSKYYKAVCTSVKPTHLSYNYSNVDITFDCYPYRYSTDTTTLLINSSTTITVEGTYYSEPIINIYGNGNGTITVNGVTTSVYVDGYLTLDSERLLAYKDNTVCLSQMVGEFPRFQVGDNTISFSGGVTSLEVFKNERWL